MVKPGDSNTRAEREALRGVLNLADGHSRPDTRQLADMLRTAYLDAFEETTEALERRLIDVLVEAGQQTPLSSSRYYFSYSASSATELVVKYLARHSRTVMLIEPCFDNIPAMLEYLKVRHQPASEQSLDISELTRTLDRVDVLWIVMPNNPTSWVLNRDEFAALAEHLKSRNALLVLDACFRHYSTIMESYDQYGILERTGVDYIVIEDTGKTWASEEIKVAVTATSSNLAAEFHELHEALLLRVSPVFLKLLTTLIEKRSYLQQVKSRVEQNRAVLKEALADLPVTLASDTAHPGSWALPLEWLTLSDEVIEPARVLCEDLKDEWSVHVLPGERFYWSTPSLGTGHIRVALNRDTKTFNASVEVLERGLSALIQTDRRPRRVRKHHV